MQQHHQLLPAPVPAQHHQSTPFLPAAQPTPRKVTFHNLDPALQYLVLAYASAPFDICRATADVPRNEHLLSSWIQLHPCLKNRLLNAAKDSKWGVCSMIVKHRAQGEFTQYERSATLYYAAKDGQLGLVKQLLQWGAWVDLWGDVSADAAQLPDASNLDASDIDSNYSNDDDSTNDVTESTGPADASSDQGSDYDHQQTLETIPNWPTLGSLGHPFTAAAHNGHAQVCALLLEQGIALREVGRAVDAAAYEGHLAVIQLLHRTRPDVNQPVFWNKSLHAAVQAGRLEIVQYLLDQGADPNDTSGSTWSISAWHMPAPPAARAAADGNLEMLHLLLQRGATLGWHWHDAVTKQAQQGHVEVLRLLLTYQPPQPIESTLQQHQESLNHTLGLALGCAVDGLHSDVVRLLLSHAAAQVPQDASQEQLHTLQGAVTVQGWGDALTTAATKGYSEMLQLLLTHVLPLASSRSGAVQQQRHQLEEVGQALSSALNFAAMVGAIHSAHLLAAAMLTAGLPAGSLEAACSRALTGAAARGHLPVVDLLLQHGADVNHGVASFSTEGPLCSAMRHGHMPVVVALLQKGAHTGPPALMFALKAKMSEPLCTLLLQHGASDTEANKALFKAAQLGYREVTYLLLHADQHPVSGDAMASRYTAALCGAASYARPKLVGSLLTSIGQSDQAVPVSLEARQQVINTALQAALIGRHYQLGDQDQGSGLQTGKSAGPTKRPLATASSEQRFVVRLLLHHGADPGCQEGAPMSLAVQHCTREIVKTLLQAGSASTDQADRVDLACKAAARHANLDMVMELLNFTVKHSQSHLNALLTECSELLMAAGCTPNQAIQAAVAQHKVKAALAFLKHAGTAVPLNPSLRKALQGLAEKARKTNRSDAEELLYLLHPFNATSRRQ